MEHESDDYTNCNWCSWYSHQRIGTRAGELGNKVTGGNCSNYIIVEIGQNTEKSKIMIIILWDFEIQTNSLISAR